VTLRVCEREVNRALSSSLRAFVPLKLTSSSTPWN